MPGIRLTNNHDRSIAANDLAVAANFFNRRSDFHCNPRFCNDVSVYDGLSPKQLTEHPGLGSALQIVLLHQSFVLMRHEVSLQLSHEIHDYHHDNEQGRSAEIERDIILQDQKLWKQTNQSYID